VTAPDGVLELVRAVADDVRAAGRVTALRPEPGAGDLRVEVTLETPPGAAPSSGAAGSPRPS
jgi:hypothetical protein